MDRLTKYTAELRKRLIDLRDELETAYDSISQLDGAKKHTRLPVTGANGGICND